ncbi:MAG: hypothetical protein AB7S41_12410 [Parvibaculaceae bacterium]
MADLLFAVLLVSGAAFAVCVRRSLPLLAISLLFAPLPAVLAGHYLDGGWIDLAGEEAGSRSFWLLAAASYIAVWTGIGTGALFSAIYSRSTVQPSLGVSSSGEIDSSEPMETPPRSPRPKRSRTADGRVRARRME